MSTVFVFLALGLANWLGTLLITDSKLFQPLRIWVGGWPEYFAIKWMDSTRRWQEAFYYGACWVSKKLSMLITCPLCTGVWVGFALAVWAPPVFGTDVLAFILTGLVIKALGHFILTGWSTLDKKGAVYDAETEALRTVPDGDGARNSVGV